MKKPAGDLLVDLIFIGGFVVLVSITVFGVAFSAPRLDAVLYNGLVVPEMSTIANAMTARGQHVEVMYHDQESGALCPPYILGHSMGGIAALENGASCARAGHAPKAIVTIDPTGYIGMKLYCPRGVRCLNYYDPTHLVGGGARAVIGAANHKMSGYTHLQLPSVPSVVAGALSATR